MARSSLLFTVVAFNLCLQETPQSHLAHAFSVVVPLPRLLGTMEHSRRFGGSIRMSTASMVEGSYGAEQIEVLEGLEPVRKRPGMYIGSTGTKGLHHLVYEIVDNSVDEAMAGHCTRVEVTLSDGDVVTVQDNGRGIPCDVHAKTGKSALETVLTILHAGGKFGGNGYKVSGGLHGVGISVVNALSEWLEVEVTRDESVNSLKFMRGKTVGSLVTVPLVQDAAAAADSADVIQPRVSGTMVSFKPDSTIFKDSTSFEFERLATRLDELAYLNANLTIVLRDARTDQSHNGLLSREFVHAGGIAEYIELLCMGKSPLTAHLPREVPRTVYARAFHGDIDVDVAFRWSSDVYTESVVSFANNIRTSDGGTHVDGFRAVITRTINAAARRTGKLKESASNIAGEYIREGLTAVVSVKVPDPEFEGQTKNRLGSPGVRSAVDTVVGAALLELFEWHPKLLDAIVLKAAAAQDAAKAAKAAKDLVRRKSLLTSTVLPGKLADCSMREPSMCEIFVVEGDSAAGSAKQGRDRNTQAILPLRGKILNIEKAAPEKIYQNAELQALISALGLGMHSAPFDPDSLRYHRIVIMTDADVDGAHIRILLLTFLFRYQREIVEKGYVYIACPPLYKVTQGATNSYYYTQEELDEFKDNLAPESSKIIIQRFKGLGEMMPQQLWDTTMNPVTRRMRRVTVEDAVMADRMLTVLMGDAVAPRRDFITSRVENLSPEDLDF